MISGKSSAYVLLLGELKYFPVAKKQHLLRSPLPLCLEFPGREVIWSKCRVKASEKDILNLIICHCCPCFSFCVLVCGRKFPVAAFAAVTVAYLQMLSCCSGDPGLHRQQAGTGPASPASSSSFSSPQRRKITRHISTHQKFQELLRLQSKDTI